MTIPAPALTALLDELDRLRAAASEGPWTVEADGYGVDCLVTRPGPGGPGLVAAAISKTADAALIVAAVNAVPRLTAAIRAALELHKPYELPLSSERLCDHDEFPWPCATFHALAAALEETDA